MTEVLAASGGTFRSLNVAVEVINNTGATGTRTFVLSSGEKVTISFVIEDI